MGVLWHKLRYDLWENKGRTLRVVLIIAMGALAIGVIISSRELIIPNMQAGWQSMNPAMINFGVGVPLTDDELIALKSVDGVVEVEGMANTTVEWRVRPDDPWSTAGLTMRDDYDNQKMNQLQLVGGDWPHGDVMGTEQGAETSFGIPEGEQVYLRINNKIHQVQLGGTLYNQIAAPASFGGTAQFYTTRERYGELTGNRNFSTVMANAAEFDEERVTAIADEMENKLERQNKNPFGTFPARVSDPNKHFFQDSLDGLFFLLGFLGLLAIGLGLLLVYNTINAIITQQVDQIGIMKAVGATSWQIFRLYLLNAFIYGLLATLVAMPLGALGGWGIASWLISGFNADPGSFTLSPLAMSAQLMITLVAPVVIAIVPVFLGTRISVREAISTYGLSTGSGFVERLLARTRRVSQLVLVTISNTFRNKWRVVLMQVTLVTSGLIFMMIITVRDSVVYTFDDVLFSILNYDINLIFDDPQRISEVEEIVLSHPDVAAAETWGFAGGSIRLQGEPETSDDAGAFFLGVPLPTELYGHQLRAGRWLQPDDSHAVVLNEELAEEAGVGVGDWITYQEGPGETSQWRVVGLLYDPVLTNSAHVPREVLLRELGRVGRVSTVWIKTVDGVDPASVAPEMRRYLEDNQVDLNPQRGVFGLGDTAQETGQAVINQFNFIVVLLAIMALIIGGVGSIALSGALSLSVLERRREIGVMRAIGASSWKIARLFVGEGLILGWMSWIIALPLSLVAGRMMLNAIGAAFDLSLVYNFTPVGPVMWLVIITVLSVLASLLPSRGAMKISVRESLAYQ